MALIICPECGKQVSDRAGSCPNCGYPISEYVEEQRLIEEERAEKERKEAIITFKKEHEAEFLTKTSFVFADRTIALNKNMALCAFVGALFERERDSLHDFVSGGIAVSGATLIECAPDYFPAVAGNIARGFIEQVSKTTMYICQNSLPEVAFSKIPTMTEQLYSTYFEEISDRIIEIYSELRGDYELDEMNNWSNYNDIIMDNKPVQLIDRVYSDSLMGLIGGRIKAGIVNGTLSALTAGNRARTAQKAEDDLVDACEKSKRNYNRRINRIIHQCVDGLVEGSIRFTINQLIENGVLLEEDKYPKNSFNFNNFASKIENQSDNDKKKSIFAQMIDENPGEVFCYSIGFSNVKMDVQEVETIIGIIKYIGIEANAHDLLKDIDCVAYKFFEENEGISVVNEMLRKQYFLSAQEKAEIKRREKEEERERRLQEEKLKEAEVEKVKQAFFEKIKQQREEIISKIEENKEDKDKRCSYLYELLKSNGYELADDFLPFYKDEFFEVLFSEGINIYNAIREKGFTPMAVADIESSLIIICDECIADISKNLEKVSVYGYKEIDGVSFKGTNLIISLSDHTEGALPYFTSSETLFVFLHIIARNIKDNHMAINVDNMVLSDSNGVYWSKEQNKWNFIKFFKDGKVHAYSIGLDASYDKNKALKKGVNEKSLEGAPESYKKNGSKISYIKNVGGKHRYSIRVIDHNTLCVSTYSNLTNPETLGEIYTWYDSIKAEKEEQRNVVEKFFDSHGNGENNRQIATLCHDANSNLISYYQDEYYEYLKDNKGAFSNNYPLVVVKGSPMLFMTGGLFFEDEFIKYTDIPEIDILFSTFIKIYRMMSGSQVSTVEMLSEETNMELFSSIMKCLGIQSEKLNENDGLYAVLSYINQNNDFSLSDKIVLLSSLVKMTGIMNPETGKVESLKDDMKESLRFLLPFLASSLLRDRFDSKATSALTKNLDEEELLARIPEIEKTLSDFKIIIPGMAGYDVNPYFDAPETGENSYTNVIIRLWKEIPEEKQKARFRKEGVCQYCGAPFKAGLLFTKCINCKKLKDY